MRSLETLDISNWNTESSDAAVDALESGKVVFFPHLAFTLTESEKRFLNPDIVNPKSKNISYDIGNDRFAGSLLTGEDALELKEMVKRFAIASRKFLVQLIPHYEKTLVQAKTSFRPVEIFGRKSSYKKDDTRLHVDSFPSSPTQGKRILRLFSNVHPGTKPRVWHIGEPFEDVVKKMAPRARRPLCGEAALLQFLRITKSYRTPYDHYMLQMHDAMKYDMDYQKNVPQEEMLFPPGSSWMVYTDQASHAAMSGQHVLEQTFHLPVSGLKNPHKSPLKVLEKYLNRALV